VDTALLRERRITGHGLDGNQWRERTVWSWYRYCEEKTKTLISCQRTRRQVVKRKTWAHAIIAAPRSVDDQRTPQPTLHYPQAHHRRKPHCLADESRMSAILMP